ncbi:15180_t:CDS:2, partial [Gigaspora margarita]
DDLGDSGFRDSSLEVGGFKGGGNRGSSSGSREICNEQKKLCLVVAL